MPEVEPSPHSPQYTDDSVLWWVRLCRWLWKLVTLMGISVVLSLAASLLASWLTSPQGRLPSTSPFAWLLVHWFVVLPVGLCFFLLALLIGALSRWPSSVKNEGESSGQIKKVAAPPEAAVLPSPSTATQHLSGDSPLQPTIPTDELDLPAPSFFIGRKMEQDWLAERLDKGGPSAISATVAWVALAKPRWWPGLSSSFASVNQPVSPTGLRSFFARTRRWLRRCCAAS